MTVTAAPPQTVLRPVYTIQPQWRANYADFCFFEGAFSQDDVSHILENAQEFPEEEATVGNYRSVDTTIRSSIVRWMHPRESTVWIFDRLVSLVGSCNESRYGFDLTGLSDGLQVAEYRPGGFFSWHKDHGPQKHSVRKLSVTVQLSHPEEYEGGEMEFLANPEVDIAPKTFGTAIVFPSFVMHRVRPVTNGTRRSLVGWFSGPPYR